MFQKRYKIQQITHSAFRRYQATLRSAIPVSLYRAKCNSVRKECRILICTVVEIDVLNILCLSLLCVGAEEELQRGKEEGNQRAAQYHH